MELHSGKPASEHSASPLYYCLVGPLLHPREGPQCSPRHHSSRSPSAVGGGKPSVTPIRSGPDSPPRQAVFLLGSKSAVPSNQNCHTATVPLQAVSPPAVSPGPRAPHPGLRRCRPAVGPHQTTATQALLSTAVQAPRSADVPRAAAPHQAMLHSRGPMLQRSSARGFSQLQQRLRLAPPFPVTTGLSLTPSGAIQLG
ncbi:hypothetical protein NDU88_000022 [Pleurodeles waltl]|uniref:Uncharacterized protein n=1 Tax=Pleurodeles waltl TaxID=8319 RepID=A0AAV7KVL0_PLEWA|nr:hypothetical protein NDU88_000022 [Pleurodeles waltl]